MPEVGTLAAAFVTAAGTLRKVGFETPELDARLLLCHAAGLSHEAFIADAREALLPDAAARLDGAIARRLKREPVASPRELERRDEEAAPAGAPSELGGHPRRPARDGEKPQGRGDHRNANHKPEDDEGDKGEETLAPGRAGHNIENDPRGDRGEKKHGYDAGNRGAPPARPQPRHELPESPVM